MRNRGAARQFGSLGRAVKALIEISISDPNGDKEIVVNGLASLNQALQT